MLEWIFISSEIKVKGMESGQSQGHRGLRGSHRQGGFPGLSAFPCILPRLCPLTCGPDPCCCDLRWKRALYLGEQPARMELAPLFPAWIFLPLWKQLGWASTNLLWEKYDDKVSNLYWVEIYKEYLNNILTNFLNTVVSFSICIFYDKKHKLCLFMSMI